MTTGTLEITGTAAGTPQLQWAAESNARTGTSSGWLHSVVYMSQPFCVQALGASQAFWDSMTGSWELIRLSQRTPWRAIIGSDLVRDDWIELFAHQIAPTAEVPIGDAEMLGRVRHYFSLNTTELAAVLGVGRPTVYAWMQGGPIRPGNRERLAAVYRIARSWWQRNKQPLGSLLQLKGVNGRSVLDLLSADPIDTVELEPYFKVASQRIQRATQERNKGVQPLSVLAKRLGIPPVPDAVRERTLRTLGQRGRKI